MTGIDAKIVTHGFGRRSPWSGRSGRLYELIIENIDTFALHDSDLHMIAKGSHVLWVGSSNDLVGDPLSRSRFRLALDCADRVFRLSSANGDGDRYATIWDLEGAEPSLSFPLARSAA